MRRHYGALAGLLAGSIVVFASLGSASPDFRKLAASDAAPSAFFGSSVAVSEDGNTVVVGAPDGGPGGNGAAYVYVKTPASLWTSTTQVAELTASDAAPGSSFGSAVAISGDTIVVGSPGTSSATGLGAAYVYVKPAGGWANMTQTAELTGSDEIYEDQFANAVAIDGATIVVGSPAANGFTGQSYVFVEPAGGWVNATQTAELTGSDAFFDEEVGISVAVSGDTVAVVSEGLGTAYVYVEPAGGWTNMTQTAELSSTDGPVLENAIAITGENGGGTTIVVGAVYAPPLPGAGAAYVFVEPFFGWTNMTQTAKLTPSDETQRNTFGSSVTIFQNTIVVGDSSAPYNSSPFGEEADYLYLRPAGGWVDATENNKFVPVKGVSDGFCGYSFVAIAGAPRSYIAMGNCFANGAAGATLVAVDPSTFITLQNLPGTGGFTPFGSLVQGTDGNLYGTMYYGGTNQSGTVFSVTPTGALTTLYSFCAQAGCADGGYPYAGLVLGTDGNLYGTAQFGGGSACSLGCGTVFEITQGGALTTLHTFDSTDGAYPMGALVQGFDGSFYGTTAGGGSAGDGTVFKITPAGVFSSLHSFNSADGSDPVAGLIQASDGNFYGTTSAGGNAGAGTVFQMTPAGALITLHSFAGYPVEGSMPNAPLVEGSDTRLYGTTIFGGPNNTCGLQGCGTVFAITTGGTLITLHNFDYGDGAFPYGGLTYGEGKKFYGAAAEGGFGYGTIFEMTPAGTLTTLHSFDSTDGANPSSAPLQATNGSFYGTTPFGEDEICDSGGCTIFSLDVTLPSFVKTVPAAGKVGKQVLILGTDLTGASSVTFGGVAASFTVSSPTLITATVPAGLAQGTTTVPVQVTTPAGTFSTVLPFLILP